MVPARSARQVEESDGRQKPDWTFHQSGDVQPDHLKLGWMATTAHTGLKENFL